MRISGDSTDHNKSPSGFGGKWSHCHSCDDVTAEPWKKQVVCCKIFSINKLRNNSCDVPTLAVTWSQL